MAWMTPDEISRMGFAAYGTELQLSDHAVFHNCGAIRIGSRTRIDDFCILSAGAGGIHIGNNVHIAAGVSMVGAAPIRLEDFTGISAKCSVFSSNDDYRGNGLTNPTVPDRFKAVTHAEVLVARHGLVGAGCVILPGTTIEEGVSVGALSVVRGRLESFGIYAGVPAKRIAERKRDLLAREVEYLDYLAKR